MKQSESQDPHNWRVFLLARDDRGAGKGIYALGRTLGVSAESARRVLKSAPVEVPINLGEAEARDLAADLDGAGLAVEARPIRYVSETPCRAHPRLANDGECEGCRAWICVVCKAEAGGAALCPKCAKHEARKRRFWLLRVAVLLVVLASVVFWGWEQERRRELRKEWRGPVTVGVVLLARNEIPDANVQILSAKLEAIEGVLADEFARYRPGKGFAPVDFEVLGTQAVDAGPPMGLPASAGIVDNLKLAMAIDDYVSPSRNALVTDTDRYTSIMYVVVTTPEDGETETFVEGISEVDGDTGLIEVDLDASMAYIAAIAIAHEAFHTLGATDKYDNEGFPVIPTGLAEPDGRYPQSRAEIMGRMVALSPTEARMPGSVVELRVNEYTAREIGWLEEPGLARE